MLSITMTMAQGRTVEGVLLAMSRERMRVALQDSDDTLELRHVDGCWMTDDETAVEIEALLTDGRSNVSRFAELFPRVLTAGRG